jgi:hypothetical protein
VQAPEWAFNVNDFALQECMAVDIVWLADLIALSRLPNASTPGFGRLLPAPFSPESPRLAPEVSSPLSEFALVLPLKLPFLLIKRAHYATWMHTTALSSQVAEGSVSIQTPKYDIGEPVSWFSTQKGRLRLPSFPGCGSLPPA